MFKHNFVGRSDAEHRLDQSQQPAAEFQRRIGDGEADTVTSRGRDRLVGKVGIRFLDIAVVTLIFTALT